MTAKPAWRRWAAAVTLPATPVQNSQLVEALVEFLAERSGQVLTYRPMQGELDLDPLAELIGQGRLVTTRTPPSGPLTVHPFASDTEVHTFGFVQPTIDSTVVDHHEIAVALVPGVLFARDGTRLGHGRGYYDQLLSCCAPSTIRVGIALAANVVDRLPREDHDVAMTHLATEHGITKATQVPGSRFTPPIG